jgi:phosphate/sulfate permease
MVGSRYCHICGAAREAIPVTDPHWARHLELHNIKQGLGLPLASLIAFIGGIGCILAALASGMIYSERNVLEWEAVQAFRIQWLLAALVAFVAGVLLKKSSSVKD